MSASAYGSATLRLWYHGLRDRLAGRHARANARWGHLRAPADTGRVLWIHTGAAETSVRIGAELLGAIRQRRHDLRLVLTFEEDYPQALEKRLRGLKKIGYGYGPCDAPRAIRRSFERLDPFALLCVDAVAPNLLREAQRRGVHSIAFNAPLSPDMAGREDALEACYPRDARQAADWTASGRCPAISPPADPLSLLVEAQVEPTFRAVVSGTQAPGLAWMNLASMDEFRPCAQAWRGSPLADASVLFVSVDTGTRAAASPPAGLNAIRLSTWDRTPLAPGTLVWVDEPRWYPALAVSSDFIHLASAPREVLWQALAGGVPVSFRALAAIPALAHDGEGDAAFPCDPDLTEALARWAAYRADSMGARRQGDVGRRRFWEERRRSGRVLEQLLQRVYDW